MSNGMELNPNLDYFEETDAREVRTMQEIAIADDKEIFITNVCSTPTVAMARHFPYSRIKEKGLSTHKVTVSRTVGSSHVMWWGINVISFLFHIENATQRMMTNLVSEVLTSLRITFKIDGNNIVSKSKIVGEMSQTESFGDKVFLGCMISLLVDYSEAKDCVDWYSDIRETAGLNQVGYAFSALQITTAIKNQISKHCSRTPVDGIKDTKRIKALRASIFDTDEWIKYGEVNDPDDYTNRESDL